MEATVLAFLIFIADHGVRNSLKPSLHLDSLYQLPLNTVYSPNNFWGPKEKLQALLPSCHPSQLDHWETCLHKNYLIEHYQNPANGMLRNSRPLHCHLVTFWTSCPSQCHSNHWVEHSRLCYHIWDTSWQTWETLNLATRSWRALHGCKYINGRRLVPFLGENVRGRPSLHFSLEAICKKTFSIEVAAGNLRTPFHPGICGEVSHLIWIGTTYQRTSG